MRRGDVIAAQFETVAVAIELRIVPIIRAGIESPAAVDHHRRRAHPQIPAIVGIPPGPASAEDVARTEVPLGAEAVGVAANRRIIIQIGIAIQNQIIRGKSRFAGAAGDVQAGVAVVMNDAILHDV